MLLVKTTISSLALQNFKLPSISIYYFKRNLKKKKKSWLDNDKQGPKTNKFPSIVRTRLSVQAPWYVYQGDLQASFSKMGIDIG